MGKIDPDKRLQEIGARIRQRRRELDMTQEQLAKGASVSKSFVSDMESGQTAASGLKYLSLAEALDVEVQWLLTGTALPEPCGKPSPIKIPQELSKLAEEMEWPYSKVLDIAAALDAIVARRTRGGKRWEPSRENILMVEKALNEDEKA